MKTAFTFFIGLLLSVYLTLYGPLSMAGTGSGAVFSMEICADGIAKTVLFDVDGNPVEPVASCPECLTCCQATEALVPENWSVSPSLIAVEIVLEHLSPQNPLIFKRHILPAPRGPPAVQISMIVKTGLVLADHPEFGQITRSDGRLLRRDAFA